MTAQRPTTEQHPDPELLSDYALGRLSEAELEGIAEHLDQCDDCQETLTSLAGEDTLIRGLAMEVQATSHDSEAELAAVLESLKDQPRDETLDFASEQADLDEAGTPQTFRDYRLLDKLGSGGMGTVYRANHQRLGRLVAIKVLPSERMRQPQAVARFSREMQAVGNLDHRHIVRAFDAGEIDGKHFLAMELIDGIDLSALSKQEGPLPVGVACELVHQAALGLQYAHDQGLVHRDVKPSNLMLDRTGTVKVLDLGLARLLSDTSGKLPAEDIGKESLADSSFQTLDPTLTGTDRVMGTPDYMAPEQCLGGRGTRAKVDARSDVYSLGATLYKLLAGNAPYSGSEFDTLAKKITGLSSGPVPPITKHREDLPKPLVKLLGQMLEKDPESRPQTAAEVAKSLEPFASAAEVQGLLTAMNGETASVAGNTSPPLAVSPPSGSGRKWLIGAACFSFLLAAIVLLKLQTPEGQLTVEVPPEARDQVQVEVRQGDQIKVFNLEEGWEARLDEGNWDIRLRNGGDEFKLDKDQVTIERDSSQLVRIVLKPATEEITTEVVVSGNTATGDRSTWPLDCTLYTKAYEFDEEDRIRLTQKLRWQVRTEYRGHTPQGPVVDPRITIALVDDQNSFWPMIAKVTLRQAATLQEAISETLKKFENETNKDNDLKYLAAELKKSLYEIDEIGRIELPQAISWTVGYSPQPKDSLAPLFLQVQEPRKNRKPFTANMSRDTAKRLATQLSQVIETKKREQAKKRPRPRTVAAFHAREDKPISKSYQLVSTEYGRYWGFESEKATTHRLFEIEKPDDIENCVVTFRARMKTRDLGDKAYLEMWVRVPPNPEAFSKGFHHAVTGTNDWATYETPFFLKKGEKADLLKLNVVTEGSGTIFVKDVEVIVSPLSESPFREAE